MLKYLEEQKLPIVIFPSARQHILPEVADPQYAVSVQLFDEFDVPYHID